MKKTNRKAKDIKREAMKTRFFLTALMIALTTCAIAGSNNFKGEDTLSTFNLAIISDQNGSESVTGEVIHTVPAEIMPSGLTSVNSNTLEEWMESRESWENENTETIAGTMESVNLQGWLESRAAWEQESTENVSAPLTQPVDLEGWVTGLENWEQEDYEAVPANLTESVDLRSWIENMENWEQK
jgi:hypothetical protein